MNMTAYLNSRGWKLYRKSFEGAPATWVSPYESKVYPQKEALVIERLKS